MSEGNDLTVGASEENLYTRALMALMIIIYGAVLVRTAWISDDACITFRTVENFINGYGLRYNPAERVQTYTHPLWLFCLSVIHFFVDRIYYTSLALSMGLSIFAVILLGTRIAIFPLMGMLAIWALIQSKAFVDYSTSGLENPLTHLLLAGCALVYFSPEMTRKRLFLLSLFSSLVALNRLDAILLVLPLVIHSMFRYRKLTGLFIIALGFLPLIAWECFSVVYYGFPFPNTAYAKLNTGIPMMRLAKQGILYFFDSLDKDPITLLGIFVAVFFSWFSKDTKLRVLSVGIALYLVYIVKIGGDFMSGRFFATPFFLSMMILSRLPVPSNAAFLSVPFALVLLFGFLPETPNLMSDGKLDWDPKVNRFNKGIADERKFYFQRTGLLTIDRGWVMPDKGGRRASTFGPGVEKMTTLGFHGYHAGPDRHLVDIWGLADPLIARLPTYGAPTWSNRIGHFTRHIPEGYLETLETGEDSMEDRDLADYFQHLTLIVRGDIGAPNRFRTIWKMNTGAYDHLIDFERYIRPPRDLETGGDGEEERGNADELTNETADPGSNNEP